LAPRLKTSGVAARLDLWIRRSQTTHASDRAEAERPDRGASSLDILQRMRRLLLLLVVIWLVIGAVAVGQRGYFGSSPENCAGVATITVTVVAGPMNYLGINPKIRCRLPQPSS
jgi:hypothetical protein